jgi:tetratricopeptide (TPR) repeat protein
LEELEKDVEKGKVALSSLRRKLWLCNNDLWRYARVSYALGRIYFTAEKPTLAEKRIRKAIKTLEESHPVEVRSLGLRALLVQSLLNQEKFDVALQEAQQALLLDPLNPSVRDALGDGYLELKEYQRAIDVWLEALLQKPDNTNIHLKIGITYYYVARDRRDFRQRNDAYQQATKYLRQALDLYEFNQSVQEGLIYYFLGILHLAWGVYEEAISCFRISQALGYERLTSRFYLGYAYLKNKLCWLLDTSVPNWRK